MPSLLLLQSVRKTALAQNDSIQCRERRSVLSFLFPVYGKPERLYFSAASAGSFFVRSKKNELMQEPVIIRKATKADMAAVLGLVKELAEYEKAPNDVVVTVADLERDGFGEHPLFFCFVAERGKCIVGMALYYINYSTWKGPCVFLEDIVVTQSERKSGIGKQLFEAVMRAAKERGARRMSWQVLDWNEPAIRFYEKYKPQVLNEWLNYRLTEEQLSGL